MASTYSSLKFELITTGEQSGTWGDTTNTNIGTAIQEAITGSADVTFASGTVTLTLSDTNNTQTARNLRLNLTGTSGGAQNLIVPAIEKQYIVYNGCADTITIKNSTGTGVAVPAGKTMVVFNNGTNVVDVTTHATSLTLGSALPVTSGGTGVTTSTGSGNNVLSTSPTLTTPILGTPTSGTLTNCTGLPISTGVSGLGSGVATFLATPSSANLASAVSDETGSGALVFANTPTLVTPVLGTPTSGTLTNCTGLPLTTGVTGTLPAANGGTGITSLGSGVATFLGTPSSANLAAAVTDETGSGALVFASSPTLSGTPLAPTASVGTDSTQIATTAFVRDIIPTGIISLWYGSIVSVPSGWYLCDGNNGTPDLRDRFIVGAGSTYAVAATGGSASVTPAGTISGTVGGTALTEAQMPKHYHQMIGPNSVSGGSYPVQNDQGTGSFGNFGGGTPDDAAQSYGTFSTGGSATSGSYSTGTSNGDSHTHSFSGTFTGTSGTNLPPYYALAYIMKA